MLKEKLLSSLVLIALVSGCALDDEEKDTPSSLVGIWNSACEVDDSDPEYEESNITSFEFTETELIIKDIIYSDLYCDELLIEFTVSGTYEIGENVVTPTGVDATEIDLILTEVSSSWGHDIEDYNMTLQQLFVREGTYLYFGNSSVELSDEEPEESIRPTDINFSSWLELQE